MVSFVVLFLLALPALVSADCSATDCASCLKGKAGLFGLSIGCTWCPETASCHAKGSFFNKCSRSQVISSAGSCPAPVPLITRYNPTESVYCAVLSKAAYDKKFLKKDNLPTDFEVVRSFEYNLSRIESVAAYIGVSKAKKRIYFVNRGTPGVSWQLLNQAIDVGRTLLAGLGIVNYYAKNGEKLYGIAKPVFLETISKYPNFGVTFTGHSLGGALATMEAFFAISVDKLQLNDPYVYTFGQPRVGDKSFGDAVTRTVLNGRFFRVVHGLDPIPSFPNAEVVTSWGPPVHFTTEIYYKKFACRYRECLAGGEDKTCSAGVNFAEKLLGIKDHDLDKYITSIGPC